MSKCTICNKETSKVLECSVCGDEVCPSCQEQCSVCGKWACHRHIVCLLKNVYICTECYANKLVEGIE